MMKSNKGITLLELIIAIAILAILVGFITPQYMKYVHRSRQATDVENAQKIGEAFERAFVYDEDAYQIYTNWKSLETTVNATVEGVNERYKVYLILSTETKGFFSGGTDAFKRPLSSGKCFYDIINEEMGVMYETKGKKDTATYVNEILVPNYKVVGPDGNTKIDRWRVCKRKDNGRIEVWSAYDLRDGKSYGGKPCYRVWPSPDDIYTK
ncbi:MAG: prepilin-type N-terminal cleavage/methylation domain-containing protein [Lachnospiraceae bacterium]|nr:prepilin-type N-terminal cleavage/methylation domain-containing protein [Lachnospiraceae bacterium]